MNINKVRSFFQKPLDIAILTDNNIDLSKALYSLQQPVINSDDMYLHITTIVDPELDGALIIIDGQKWLVHKHMKEKANINLYVYKLILAFDILILHKLTRHANAIGTYIDKDTLDIECACALGRYGKKDRDSQPLDSYEQEFIVARRQLPDYKGAYMLSYHDLNYKISSFELDGGIIIIRAQENI